MVSIRQGNKNPYGEGKGAGRPRFDSRAGQAPLENGGACLVERGPVTPLTECRGTHRHRTGANDPIADIARRTGKPRNEECRRGDNKREERQGAAPHKTLQRTHMRRDENKRVSCRRACTALERGESVRHASGMRPAGGYAESEKRNAGKTHPEEQCEHDSHIISIIAR